MSLKEPTSSIQETLRNLNPTFIAILGGVLSAAFSLLPLSFSILALVLNYFSTLPLYLVAFGWGWQKAAKACFVALATFSLFLGIPAALSLGATTLLPVLILAAAFLHKVPPERDEDEWYPAGYAISWITGYSVILFLGFTAYLMTQYGTPDEAIKAWFLTLEKQMLLKEIHTKLIWIFPGIIAVSWIMMNLVNAIIAQKILKRHDLNIRPYPGPKDRQFHLTWDIIFLFGIMLELTGHPLFAFIGTNITLISCVPLYLLGLSVINAWLQQVEEARIWIFCIVVLSFLLVWPGLIVVVLGVLEPSFRLSQRFRKNL